MQLVFVETTQLCCHRQKAAEGEENRQPQSVPVGYQDYVELIVFEKQQTQENLWKQSRSYPFVKTIHI